MKGFSRSTSLWIGLLLALSLTLTSVGATAAESVRYVHTDHLGTPIVWTDENGNIIKTSEYEPYGQLLNRPVEDGPGYTGHVEDAATGLTYMQQRYYDPWLGRFLSNDPVTFSSAGVNHFNRYWYANGNPYNYSDPDGQAPGYLQSVFASPEVAKTLAGTHIADAQISAATSDATKFENRQQGFAAASLATGVTGLGASSTPLTAPAGAVLLGTSATISIVATADKVVQAMTGNYEWTTADSVGAVLDCWGRYKSRGKTRWG